MNRPAITTPQASTALESVHTAITVSTAVKATKFRISTRTVPKRCCNRGATTTEVNANARPQPKKMSPI